MKSTKNEATSIRIISKDIEYYPHFLNQEQADPIFEQLKQLGNWQQYPIKLFGKTFLQPRLIAWQGDAGVSYTYSKNTLIADGWSSELLELKHQLEVSFKANFNAALLNWYRDGNDSMGWHADNEKELGEQPFIASISLGTPRYIHFRPKDKHQAKIKLLLEHGSLLIMKGKVQEHWQHQIPKSKKIDESRINITFRNILQ